MTFWPWKRKKTWLGQSKVTAARLAVLEKGIRCDPARVKHWSLEWKKTSSGDIEHRLEVLEAGPWNTVVPESYDQRWPGEKTS